MNLVHDKINTLFTIALNSGKVYVTAIDATTTSSTMARLGSILISAMSNANVIAYLDDRIYVADENKNLARIVASTLSDVTTLALPSDDAQRIVFTPDHNYLIVGFFNPAKFTRVALSTFSVSNDLSFVQSVGPLEGMLNDEGYDTNIIYTYHGGTPNTVHRINAKDFKEHAEAKLELPSGHNSAHRDGLHAG